MILNITRKRFTWNIIKVNFKTKEMYSIVIQLSTKQPWLLPKVDRHFGSIDIALYGWLFFYIGRSTDGVLYESKNESGKIVNPKTGQHYYLYSIDDRIQKDLMRMLIKNNYSWDIKQKHNEDGTTALALHVL